MRQFVGAGRLSRSGLPIRVALTGFLVFVGIGYATNLGLFAWKLRFSPTEIARYYRGYEPPPGSDAEFRYAKEFHELLETTHFHIYIVPTVLLVLTHVFFMTGFGPSTKIAVTVFAFAVAAADLAAPWLVRYGGAGFAWWKLLSSAGYHAALGFLWATCLWECWLARPPSRQRRESPGEA